VLGDVTPLVTDTTSTLANVLENERIPQLPLDGRDIQTLVMATTAASRETRACLSPGVCVEGPWSMFRTERS